MDRGRPRPLDQSYRTTHNRCAAGRYARAASTGCTPSTKTFGSANARGLLPSAAEGYYSDPTACTQFGGVETRLAAHQQLVNPLGAFQCILQASCIGSAQNTTYSTIPAEVDDYLFQTGPLSRQSQRNSGNNSSRPQDWAKNIVSVGAAVVKSPPTSSSPLGNANKAPTTPPSNPLPNADHSPVAGSHTATPLAAVFPTT